MNLMTWKNLKNLKRTMIRKMMIRSMKTRRYRNRSMLIRCCMKMIWRRRSWTTWCLMRSCYPTLKARNKPRSIPTLTLKANK